MVGFDLAHAAGNLPLKLHEWGPDFAVWCSYKYLNGGPGCVAGCFVHERHARAWDLPRFAGWWGHDEESRFEMGPDFRAMPGADGWQLSNPSIVSLAVLRASMDIFHEAGMERLRAKSVSLTGYLGVLAESECVAEFFNYHSARKGAARRTDFRSEFPTTGGHLCEGWQGRHRGRLAGTGHFSGCTRALVQLLPRCFPVCSAISGRDWLEYCTAYHARLLR